MAVIAVHDLHGHTLGELDAACSQHRVAVGAQPDGELRRVDEVLYEREQLLVAAEFEQRPVHPRPVRTQRLPAIAERRLVAFEGSL
ncbi:hypothetical protein DKG34_23610 [Streptomyces sp. NWU49]|nr:hypothetical protein DKG34_23610 [Streptomyces sp. NWU49]